MKRAYYFIEFKPVKSLPAGSEPDSMDNTGTGWFNCDLDTFFKYGFKKSGGKWKLIETATPEEIAQYRQIQQLSYIEQLNEKFQADGLAYQREMKNRVTAQLVGRADAVPIMREINRTVYVLLDKIAKGDWALAMLDYMDGDNNPTIQEVVDLFNEVGQKATEYYQNEYPH